MSSHAESIERFIHHRHRSDLFFMAGFRHTANKERWNSPHSFNHNWESWQQKAWKKGKRYAELVIERHPAIKPNPHESEYDYSVINIKSPDKGWKVVRTKFPSGDLERAFAAKWIEENEPKPWLNFGQGILQDLFITPIHQVFESYRWETVITKRDRFIAATVIQWLGTNCGLCFLTEVLRECGYSVVKTKEKEAA